MFSLDTIISLYEKGENKIIRIYLFIYFLLVNIFLSFQLGQEIGFPYKGEEITIEIMLLSLSSGNIILAIFFFTVCVGLTLYGVRLVTFILSILFLISTYFIKNKKGGLYWIFKKLKVITKDNKRGKNFRILIVFNDVFSSENSGLLLNFIDLLSSIFIVTLYAFKMIIEGYYFPQWADNLIGFVLWFISIYWFLNTICIKALRMEIEKLEQIIFEIRD